MIYIYISPGGGGPAGRRGAGCGGLGANDYVQSPYLTYHSST